MEKFIEAIKEQGIMHNMVKSCAMVNKMTGRSDVPVGAVEMMLKISMMKDEDLAEIFFDEVSEIGFKAVTEVVQKEVQEFEKCEALKDVDPDALFAKATGAEQKQDDKKNDAVEEAIMNLLDTVMKSIMDDLK